MLLSLCVAGVRIEPTVQPKDKTALCHHPNMQRRPILVSRVNSSEAIGKALQARWAMNNTMSVQIRGTAVVKVDVKNVRGVNGIMRSDQMNAAVAMGPVREASPAKSRSEVPSVVRRGAVTGKVADDTVNEKVSVRVVKEVNDPAARLVNRANEANHGSLVRASLIAALARTVAHQDRVEKNATDAAEGEVEAQETKHESESGILQTSRMAT